MALLVDLQLGLGRNDLFGLTADLAVSLVIAAGLGALISASKHGRWAALVLGTIWILLSFANYEHIRELGSMVALAHSGYLADPTFFRASVMAPARPLLLVAVVIGAWFTLWWITRNRRQFPVRYLLLAALPLIALSLIWPREQTVASWRQTNFVLAQTSNLFGSASPPGKQPATIDRTVEADLDGELVIEQLPHTTNVLLVILEGVSGAYIPTLRDRHGANTTIEMPELDRLARRGMAWSSFVAHQRQTNRGEYALLCGDYPKLVTSEPKMTELAGSAALDCLPAALRAGGHSTTYLQAAPMAFMLKDQFMPQAGFSKAAGDTSFDRYYHRNHWGIDDRAFLEQSVEKIEELQRSEQPWFLTLLTVGTHHPFNPPPEFKGSYAQHSPGWAMEYLDQALGEFFDSLEEMGVPDDTLIILTSDESRELVPGDSDIANSFLQAWGFLVVLHPGASPRIFDHPAMQLDLPISILDALGLADPSLGFGGRSVFRSYREPRQILWGNTHLHIVAGLSRDQRIAVCSEDLQACVASDLSQTLFAPGIDLQPTDPARLGWLTEGVVKSLNSQVLKSAARELQLTPVGPMPVWADADEQFVFGGQFLTIDAGTRADFEIEARLTGEQGSIRFHHDLIVGRRQEYVRTDRLTVGESIRIHYSLEAAVPLTNIESRFSIDNIEGPDLELDFTIARVRIVPTAGTASIEGITEHLYLIE